MATTTTTITELIPEITMAVEFYYQDKSLGRALVNYKDQTGQPGLTVEFPRFTEFTASTGPTEGAAGSSHDADTTGMPTLTMAKRTVYVPLTYEAKKGARDNMVAAIGEGIGLAFVKAVDASIFGILTATTNWATSGGATNALLNLGHIQDCLNLVEENEVDDQLYGVLHPRQIKGLRKVFTPTEARTGTVSVKIPSDVTSVWMSKGMGNFYGVDWFKSNRIGTGTVGATGGLYNGLLFSRRGIGYAFSWLEESGVEVNVTPESGLINFVLNWVDSAGVTYNSAVGKLYSSTA